MNPHDICQRADLEGYDSLEELALNLRSSWNHNTDAIWQQLDPELWELTRNSWAVLQTVSRQKLKTLLADKKFSGLTHLSPAMFGYSILRTTLRNDFFTAL